MDKDQMLDDIVSMLDSQVKNGTGHINLDYSETAGSSKSVETMGCADCSRTPLACSVPTLHQGLDDYK
jgi:hypothetical protein